MSHSWTHSWCRSPARDEAVRAAEDNRSGPLPTLEEAIFAVTERRPVPPGGGGNVTGPRTERVTLEVTHELDAPLGEWIVQVLDESLGYDETVRVVEERRWVPVGERLPTVQGDDVLTARGPWEDGGYSIVIGWWNGECWMFYGSDRDLPPVAFWMPLPPEPEAAG